MIRQGNCYRIFSILVLFMLASCKSSPTPELTALYWMDVQGDQPTLLLSDPNQGYWGPAWSHDGNRLVVTMFTPVSNKGELYLLNSDGSGLVQLTRNRRNNYLPAWSPDGQIISFISQQGEDAGTAEIFAIHVEGSNEKRLTDNNSWEYGTSWSSDGTKIIFGSEWDNQWQIYIMDTDGSNQLSLPTPAHGNAPNWSPDGTKIAFTSDRDGDDDIWVMNSDGSGQQNLTQNNVWDDNPQWSPDGTKIVFVSDRDGAPDLFLMHSDGSEATNLTKDFEPKVGLPTWSPDSKRLIFHAAIPSK